MKKLNYLWFALLTMLLAVSCSESDVISNDNGNEATVSFTLELPDGGPQTRAIGDGKSVNKLVYAIYEDENEVVSLGGENTVGFPQTLSLSLLKGKSYRIAFWAQNESCGAYTTTDLKNVTVNYTGVNNDESRDAFFKTTEEFKVNGNATLDVVLERPFAQLNVGVTTKDWDAAVAGGLTVKKSNVINTNAASAINLLNGEVSAVTAVTYKLADIPTEVLQVDTDGDGVKEDYKYLSMSYFLVGADKTVLENLELVFADADGKSVTLKQGLSSVPVQRNYRTNILGNLLTDDIKINITIDSEFDEADKNVTKPLVTTVEELEAALSNPIVTHITIEGTLGDDSHYTIYEVDRPVTIIGGGSIVTRTEESKAKVFGTFMVKADDVTIENLAIQNQGDLGGDQKPSPQVRGNIIVWAKNVVIKNNMITHGMGAEVGLANAIQIFSSVTDNPLSNYIIEGNTIEGFNNEARGSNSAGILIAEGYNSTVIGKEYAEIITATAADYKYLENNTFENTEIKLTHQNWADGRKVLYPILEGNIIANAYFKKNEFGNAYYSRVLVGLTLKHENKTFGDVTELKVELFNDITLLATNVQKVKLAANNSTATTFHTGQVGHPGYSWTSGAYPLKGYIPTADELPTKVVATYVLDGQTYMSETDVTVDAPLTKVVTTEAELNTALTTEDVVGITLGGDITLTEGLKIDRSVIIDGQEDNIFSFNKTVDIIADNVVLKNLEGTPTNDSSVSGTGTAKRAFVVSEVKGVIFDNVKVIAEGNYGIAGKHGAEFEVKNSIFENVGSAIFVNHGYKTEAAAGNVLRAKLTVTNNTFKNVWAGIGGTEGTDLTATGNKFISIQNGGEGFGLGVAAVVVGSSGDDANYLETNNTFFYTEGNKVNDYR